MNEYDKNLENSRGAVRQKREIRRAINNNEWWFIIRDVVAALTDSVDPQGYLKNMHRCDREQSKR